MPLAVRLRRFATWTGLLVSLAVAALWLLSTTYSFGYTGRDGSEVTVLWGELHAQRYTGPQPQRTQFVQSVIAFYRPGWHVFRRITIYLPPPISARCGLALPAFRSYAYTLNYPTITYQSLTIPLWIPVLLVAAPTIYLWRRDRRVPTGHCPKCGYNLNLNVSGICPECGVAIPNAA